MLAWLPSTIGILFWPKVVAAFPQPPLSLLPPGLLTWRPASCCLSAAWGGRWSSLNGIGRRGEQLGDCGPWRCPSCDPQQGKSDCHGRPQRAAYKEKSHSPQPVPPYPSLRSGNPSHFQKQKPQCCHFQPFQSVAIGCCNPFPRPLSSCAISPKLRFPFPLHWVLGRRAGWKANSLLCLQEPRHCGLTFTKADWNQTVNVCPSCLPCFPLRLKPSWLSLCSWKDGWVCRLQDSWAGIGKHSVKDQQVNIVALWLLGSSSPFDVTSGQS